MTTWSRRRSSKYVAPEWKSGKINLGRKFVNCRNIEAATVITMVGGNVDVTLSVASIARMVKLVDTRDLKSLGWKRLCRFDSGSGHHQIVLYNPKKSDKPA